MLLDVGRLESAWKRIAPARSRDGQTHTAWEVLSHELRHRFNRNFDGALLRVIALWGDNYIDYETQNGIVFQAGPATFSVACDPRSPNPSERFLLCRAVEFIRREEHLYRYIRESFEVSREDGRTPCYSRFGPFAARLERELSEAHAGKCDQAAMELEALLAMARAIQAM